MGLLDTLGLKRTAARAAAAAANDAASVATPTEPEGRQLAKGGKGGSGGPPPQLAAYQAARAPVQALLDALKAHAQSAAAQAQINQATAQLAQADVHAGKAEWPQATQALQAARALCTTGKQRADDRVGYLAKRANAVAGIMALQGVTSKANMTAMQTALANADAFANASPPNYPAAATALAGITTPVRNNRKALIDKLKGQLAKLDALDAKVKAFCAADIAKGKQLVASAETAFAAQNWSACIMHSFAAVDVVSPCERLAGRRVEYEKARTPALAALAAIKAQPALKGRVAGLEAQLAQADQLASRATMRIEDGIAALGTLVTHCQRAGIAAASMAQVQALRPLAEAELAALDKHPAAARVAGAREAVRKLLAAAAAARDAADRAPDPGPGYATTLLALQRARTELAATKTLADGLAPALAAQAAAAAPPDAAALKKALTALQADLAKAEKAPHADQAAAAFKQCHTKAEAAAQALAKNDAKGAAKPLGDAASALAQARTVQGQHAEFVAGLAGLQARLKALQALPRAAKIKARIDAVVAALAAAQAKDKAHAGADTMVALRAAEDAASAAEQADRERGAYDGAAAATTALVTALTDAALKKTLQQALADATKLADTFRFDDAHKALKRVEVRLDEGKLKAAAKANPTDPAIAALAAKMVANGGAKDVDALVQDKATTDPRMVALLAQGRFGVTFTADTAATTNPAKEAATMKALCRTFAKVPKDVKAAGSIGKITHTDSADKRDISGAWGNDTEVELTGRPNLDKQGFGTKLTKKVRNKDGTISTVKQLPAKIDKDCEAVGEPAELLSFTALHEVGHGVDDSHTYMARNGARPDHGGWTDYGAGVQPVADAVGPWVRKKIGGTNTFYQSAADRAYVIAKLLNQPAVRPVHPPGSDEAKAVDEFDRWHGLATTPGIYERESDCISITVGTLIYHEAYARQWVSYLAAARSKGLTGYQFRAPGEWFAELYAGFKAGRLGKNHPSRSWLEKL